MKINKKLNEHFVYYAISYLSSLFAFLITPLAAKLLGVDTFSWMMLGMALGGITVPLINLGSSQTFVRDATQLCEEGAVAKLAMANLWVRSLMGIAVYVVVLLWSYFYIEDKQMILPFVLFSLWAGSLGLYPAAWYDFYQESRLQQFFALFEKISSFVFVCILFVFPDKSLVVIILPLFLLVNRLFFIVIQVRKWFSEHGIQVINIFPSFKENNGTSAVVTISFFFNSLLTHGNQLLLKGNAEPVEIAAYGLVFQFLMVALIFQAQTVRLFQKVIALHCSSRTIFQGLAKHLPVMIIGSSGLAALVWLAIGIAANYIADPRIVTALNFVPILCIWLVVLGIGQIITQYIISMGLEKHYFITSVISGAIGTVLGFYLIPEHGALAVAGILLTVHVLKLIVNITILHTAIKHQNEASTP